jgi:phosphatidylglycerophosphatase A
VPAASTVSQRLAVFIATAGGIGSAPLAPGTVASLATVVFLGLVPFSRVGLVVFLLVVIVVGTWAAHVAEPVIGGKDPGSIVIDEVAGMTLSVVVFFPLTTEVLAAGLAFFRVFDVLKPPPARGSQRLTGGVGVMIDDLIAGIYALICVALSRWLLGWP